MGSCSSPPRGWVFHPCVVPTAGAVGCILAPLRGCCCTERSAWPLSFAPRGWVFLPCVVPTAWRRGLHSCAASRLLSHGTFRLAAFFRPLGAGCFILVWYPRLAPWAAFLRRFAAAVARNAPLGRFLSPLGAGVSSLRGTHGLAPWAAFLRRFAAAVARNVAPGRGWTRHCERDL